MFLSLTDGIPFAQQPGMHRNACWLSRRRWRITTILTGVLTLVMCSEGESALAQVASSPTPTPPSEDPPPRRLTPAPSPTEPVWYGGTVAIVDVASDLSLLALPPAGMAGIALGGPVVHAFHGRLGMAAGSLLLRGGALLTAFIIVGMPRPECEEGLPSCDSTGRLVKALVPVLAVQAADAMFFSWAPGEARQASGPALLPSIALGRGGGTLSLSGRF
jgi:hypothetical protein